LIIDLLAWAGPQLVEVLEKQDPRQRSARVSWAGPSPVPVWLDQLRELSEYWIHRQQILDALEWSPNLDPEVVGPILDGFRWAYPYRLGQVTAKPGDTVEIEIEGPARANRPTDRPRVPDGTHVIRRRIPALKEPESRVKWFVGRRAGFSRLSGGRRVAVESGGGA
jgi:hypothetical protein